MKSHGVVTIPQVVYRIILALSSVTKREYLAQFSFRPDFVVESVGTLKSEELLQDNIFKTNP